MSYLYCNIMTQLTINEVVKLFDTTAYQPNIGPLMPSIVQAVKVASIVKDRNGLIELKRASMGAFDRNNGDMPLADRKKWGYDNFLTLAYLADHPEIQYYKAVGVPDAYRNGQCYGTAMQTAKEIIEEDGIKVEDVFAGESNPSLN